jgi:O-phospho-L-seryl-tRNASec:L-selenocysteinyl-tRNA synthase
MDELETLFINLGVQKTYVQQGLQGIASRHRLFKTLLSSRELPERGWDDLNIELLLAELAAMDSNNFPHNIGAGEREGRLFSGLVSRRHHRLSHGVGRSGDLAEVQPKAAGRIITLRNKECRLLFDCRLLYHI